MGTTDDRDSLFLRRTPSAARPEDVVAPSEEALGEPAGLYVDPADRPALVASRPRRWVGPIVVALAIVVTYAGWRALQTAPSPPPVVAAPEPTPPKRAPEVAQQPAVKYPLPDALSGAKPDVSLPSLADSDAVLRAAIVSLASNTALRNLLQQSDVARRIVATIDNLPRSKVLWCLADDATKRCLWSPATQHAPIDARNGALRALHAACRAVDPEELASVYGAYYPLLQEQYRAWLPGGQLQRSRSGRSTTCSQRPFQPRRRLRSLTGAWTPISRRARRVEDMLPQRRQSVRSAKSAIRRARATGPPDAESAWWRRRRYGATPAAAGRLQPAASSMRSLR
jgi:hypothetical protein